MKRIFSAKYVFLIVVGISLSCNRKFCGNENFYSVYQTRFEGNGFNNDFVKHDLDIKQEIFSALCLSSKLKKVLIVEYRGGTQSYYSKGLLFTYDDSKTYYFKILNGKVIAGKGYNGNVALNKILLHLKKNFSEERINLDKSYDNIFDASMVNVLQYDSLRSEKFESFSFPIVVLDSLLSR